MHLTDLSDEEVVARLSSLCVEGRRLLSRLLVHLSEVETRRLHLKAAYSSMFDFCTRSLGMSEGEADRRINAARLARRFPWILERIERGEIHLSALRILAKHQNDANFETLVTEACGKSKMAVLELVARHHPRPDVPCTFRQLTESPGLTLAPDGVEAPPPLRIAPLSEARYALEMTITSGFKEKLERAKSLMRHRNASGDPAVVLERALESLLRELEKERFGKCEKPHKTLRPSKPGHVPAAVKREVYERDAGQCAWVDEHGHRCPSREFVEIDHIVARAHAGTDDAPNVRLLCQPHKRLHAEQDFGEEHVARAIHLRQQQYDATETQNDPRAEVLETVTRGLVGLGFKKTDVGRTVHVIAQLHAGGAVPAAGEWIREGIAALT